MAPDILGHGQNFFLPIEKGGSMGGAGGRPQGLVTIEGLQGCGDGGGGQDWPLGQGTQVPVKILDQLLAAQAAAGLADLGPLVVTDLEPRGRGGGQR